MNLATSRIRTALMGAGLGCVLAAGLTVPALSASAAEDLDDRLGKNQAQQRALDAEREELEHELEHTSAELIAAYAALDAIKSQIPAAEKQLADAQDLLTQLELEASLIADRLLAARAEESSITAKIGEDTAKADVTHQAIGEMAREAYKGDIAASSLTAVLDARSTEEFVQESALASTALRTQTQALRDLKQITGLNKNRQARLTAVRQQITELKAEADAKVVEADAARQVAQDRKSELDDMLARQEAATAQVEALKRDQITKDAQLAGQQASLSTELVEIVRLQEEDRRRRAAEAAARAAAAKAAADAAAAAARRAGTAPPPSSTATSAPVNGDDLAGSRPFSNPTSIVPMHVTSDFGMRLHPLLGYVRLHAGVDLRTYCNTPIYAPAAGTVQWARSMGGFGNQVLINHGYWNNSSLMTSSNHLSSFAVRSGDRVSAGQLIGFSGNTGTSVSCHLHFEAYLNGVPVDPRPMIG